MDKGLLFYVAGDSTTANFAKGRPTPSFDHEVSVIDDGACGKALSCGDYQLLAWRAPRNIYAERGTLSFFWRSRYPVGPTAFPIFRVGFSDHSSWDAVWLRIDWSGEGYEAFITDINLSRARVRHTLGETPRPDIWSHFALAWDENWGIKFYINGEKVAEEYRPAVYFTGLDQFGPHSRIISNTNVQSAYNFTRGGDIDEIAIYDRMLDDSQMLTLADGRLVDVCEPYELNFTDEAVNKGWQLRSGFDGDVPQIADQASVRKVEIHDAYDLKRWWWKGCDGIRETTWPGVYNRSRLKGRNDYFQLPDWDCYSLSGKAITFSAPDEEYNHIEVSGSAFGKLELVDDGGVVIKPLFERAQGIERSVNAIEPLKGGKIRFTNVLKEEPIGDFSLYNVTEGKAPEGVKKVSYSLFEGYSKKAEAQHELITFIKGRYLPYERNIMTAIPAGESDKEKEFTGHDSIGGYPFVNIVIPYEADDSLGLDGVELKLPKLPDDVKIAVQIKDPLWYYRNLAHFVFSAKSGQEKTVWFDTRDRILPENKCLYMTIAFSDDGYGVDFLKEATVGLVYKSAEEAKTEHIADRFTQVRDVYGHLVEEQPGTTEHDLFNRFAADVRDILRIDPGHKLAQYYYYDKFTLNERYGVLDADFVPDYQTEPVPEGVPAWAFKQVEFLKKYKHVINWLIDNRMIDNGEFGGGLSDDGDFVCTWVILVNMGCDPDRIRRVMHKNLEAFYEQGMFTNGLSSIIADELHSSEEGLISLNGSLSADIGNPKMLERAMETARSMYWLTGVNAAGHRHIKSSYFSGSEMALEAPWNTQKGPLHAAISPVWQVSRFNGNEKVRRLLIEMADSLAAHYNPETGTLHNNIRFEDDAELSMQRVRGVQNQENNMMHAAYYQTGDTKYMEVIQNRKPPCSENAEAWKAEIARRYDQRAFIAGVREYYNTHGHPWIDRVYLTGDDLLNDRLADPLVEQSRFMYPSNRIAWRFENAGDDEKLGILSPIAENDHVKLIVHNLSGDTVKARILGNEILPGTWNVSYGVDENGDDVADSPAEHETSFERSTWVSAEFAPKATTIVELRLVKQGRSYFDRCDLGISRDDIKFYDHGMNVTVHSLGNVDSPQAEVVLKNAEGKILKKAILPPLEAPRDLWPRYRDVIFNLHNVDSLEGCYVEIDPDNKLCEITRNNNIVRL
ncbi:MAG: LamG-like jellyroll fold domain-containing protein [Christensenellales bacterium]